MDTSDFCLKQNKVFKDKRGILHECFNIGGEYGDVPSGGHFYALTIEPKHARGNHFHKNKLEWFLCLKGEVRIVLKDEESLVENEIIIKGMDGKVIEIPPLIRHTLYNDKDENAIIVSYGSIPFNSDQPDTYS